MIHALPECQGLTGVYCQLMHAKLLNFAMQNACQGDGTTLAHLSRCAAKAVRRLLWALSLEMYVTPAVLCLCLGPEICFSCCYWKCTLVGELGAL